MQPLNMSMLGKQWRRGEPLEPCQGCERGADRPGSGLAGAVRVTPRFAFKEHQLREWNQEPVGWRS